MLIGDNGILAKVSEAKKEQIIAEMQEQLALKIQELQIEKEGKATLEDVQNSWIEDELKNYGALVIDIENEKIVKMNKEGVVGRFKIELNLNIIEIGYNGDTEFYYKKGNESEGKVNVTIYIQDEANGINQIEIDNNIVKSGNGTKELITISDYEVQIGTESIIKITLANGEMIEKKILIEHTYKIEIQLGEGLDIDNKIQEISHNKLYKATIIEDDTHIIDGITVTMGGEEISKGIDSFSGNIEIDQVIGDINIVATSKEFIELITFDRAETIDIENTGFADDPNLIKQVLFDKNISNGIYGVLINRFGAGKIDLTVYKEVTIYAYGDGYGDVGGNAGNNAVFQKWNGTDYEPYASVPTYFNLNRYKLIELPKGKYRILNPENWGYVRFDEWELERIK